jgi:hypothetical protein
MPRPKPAEIESAGQDSFLDVVTNIVGILIILVMVIGGRVRQIVLAPPQPSAEAAALAGALEDLEETVDSTESEIEQLQEQGRTVATAAAFAADARLRLATAVSAAKVAIDERKRDVDAARVAAAEAAARRREIEEEIRTCTLEAEGIAHVAATTQEVLAYPTPIGRTVNGEEIHVRLAGGRIAYIPLEELFELAKSHTQRQGASIAQLANRVETVGPEQGFALDYVIEAKIDQARGQVLIRSREWVVRPQQPSLGETADEALAATSRFRRVLTGAKPETAVTLWCYPDSFGEYRRVREELHRLGIPCAGRPLPDGAPIGGSTEGSKSVMQ